MASTEQKMENDAASFLIEQLCKAVFELEACTNASKDKFQWTEIEQHFRDLDMMLKKKSEELEDREKEYVEKESNNRAMIAEMEASVTAKELDLLDRVQELKDAAVAAIAETRAKFQAIFVEPLDSDKKVSCSLDDRNSPDDDFPDKTGENTENVGADVKPRPELMQFCVQMDAKGLVNFIMENQKNVCCICKELSFALESASEPARLVLDSLQGFSSPPDKVDAALQGVPKSCLVLIEAMAAFLARIDPGADHLLNPQTKQQAKAIAYEWKRKLSSAGNDAANGKSLEVEAFLQLLAAFRIASEFYDEELCKLVVVVAHRRQAPELCRSIGLTHKMPVVVQLLINSGRQIDAVRLIHAFELTESFPTVPLLKTYLKDLRRNSQGKAGNSTAAGPQVDYNALELAALRAVISCVHDYGLEAEYPLDPLEKRLAQLEKSKADNKNKAGGDIGKRHSSKRPRPNSGFKGLRKRPSRQAPPESVAYASMPQRYPHAAPKPYNFQVPSQPAYAPSPQANNAQRIHYSAAPSPQANNAQRIHYSAAPSPQANNAQRIHYSAAPSYNAPTSSYTSYGGSGLQPSNQPYM